MSKNSNVNKANENNDKVRAFILHRVKKILKERGWNTKKLAAASDTPQSTLYTFMRGIKTNSTSFYTVFHICEKMGWPYAYFFLEDGLMLTPIQKLHEIDERVKNTRARKFMRYYNLWFHLSPRQQDITLGLLEEMAAIADPDTPDKGKRGNHGQGRH